MGPKITKTGREVKLGQFLEAFNLRLPACLKRLGVNKNSTKRQSLNKPTAPSLKCGISVITKKDFCVNSERREEDGKNVCRLRAV